MTDREQGAGSGMGNKLLDEAADWFAKMRGPDADMHRPAFEAWLVRGAVHRAAYNRVAEIFTDSGRVDDPDCADAPIAATKRRLLIPAAFALGIGAMALGGLFQLFVALLVPAAGPAGAERQAPPTPHTLASGVGEIRTLRLDDGSTLVLDTDSLVSVAFTGTERRLRLLRGRARFEVAHEKRPFKVTAGDGVTTARGTIFDVRIDGAGRASVVLLRGAVDVVLSSKRKLPLQRLHPGERISYSDKFDSNHPIGITPSNAWMQAKGEFHDVSLDDVIAEANRYSAIPIVTEQIDGSTLRVSGIFSMKDTVRLSARLAELFHLARKIEPDRIVLSSPR